MLCHKCAVDKPEDQFCVVSRRYAARERHHWCNSCRNEYQRAYRKVWKARHPERFAAQKRRNAIRSYGITPERYDVLIAEQHGQCAICGTTPERGLDIDHCHASGTVRGLLCNRCNRVLGQVYDDAKLLASAIRYLKQNTKE